MQAGVDVGLVLVEKVVSEAGEADGCALTGEAAGRTVLALPGGNIGVETGGALFETAVALIMETEALRAGLHALLVFQQVVQGRLLLLALKAGLVDGTDLTGGVTLLIGHQQLGRTQHARIVVLIAEGDRVAGIMDQVAHRVVEGKHQESRVRVVALHKGLSITRRRDTHHKIIDLSHDDR